MNNLHLIIENYAHLSTDELVAIAQNPSDLELEVIPHLQSELFNRNKKQEALFLSEFLIQKQKPYTTLNKNELTEIIRKRIDAGESLESIKLDLKDNGINLFDILNDQTRLQNQTFDYLTSLKEDGLDEMTIDEKMKSTFGISEEETDILKTQLRNRGKQNLIIGYSLLFIMGILIIISFNMDGRIYAGGVALIVLGIWKIIQGYRQRR